MKHEGDLIAVYPNPQPFPERRHRAPREHERGLATGGGNAVPGPAREAESRPEAPRRGCGEVGERAVDELRKQWKEFRAVAAFARRRKVFLSVTVERKCRGGNGFTRFSKICTETTTTVCT